MFKGLKWKAVERAYKALVKKHKSDDPLIIFLRFGTDNTITRSRVKFEHLKLKMWDLYNNNRHFTEIAIVDPGNENSIVFRYNIKSKIDEGMPVVGNGALIKFWKTYNMNRRNALLKVLLSQICEEINA
jgi:hypothetical protein